MKSNAKKTLIALLCFILTAGNAASAAEIFQWIIEPSTVYGDVYFHDFDMGYWSVGHPGTEWFYTSYDVMDSYGNVLISNAQNLNDNDNLDFIPLGNGILAKIENGTTTVISATGDIMFTSQHEVSGYYPYTNLLQISVDTGKPGLWGENICKYGAMDLTGKIVIQPIYDDLFEMDDTNWFVCSVDSKYGVIDKDGVMVYDIKYQDTNWNKYAVICDQDGNNESIIFDRQTKKETRVTGEFEPIYTNFNWPLRDTDEFLIDGVLISTTGELLTEKTNAIKSKIPQTDNVSSIFTGSIYEYISNECYFVETDPYSSTSVTTFYDSKGNVIFEGCDMAFHLGGDLYAVGNNDKWIWGVKDIHNNTVLPMEYDYITQLHDNYFEANGVVYDHKGNKLDIGDYKTIMAEGDYFFIRDTQDRCGFAKVMTVPDDDLTDKLVMTVDERDMFIWGDYQANDVVPVIKNERTMLPVRVVAEALGAEVGWNEATRAVTVTNDVAEIELSIGNNTAIVNGKEIALDSPAFIENNRTYLPVRFIVENLGAKVEWVAETRQIIVTK